MQRINPIATFGLIVFIIIVGAGFSLPGRGYLAPTDIISVHTQVQAGSVAELAMRGRVSLVVATQDALEALPGIGPKTATKILKWRRQNEGLIHSSSLGDVPGIGPKTLNRVESLLRM
jgi:DNA uptake protein ComE-like DNA-binding protein